LFRHIFKKISLAKLREGDLVISTAGTNLKKVFYARNSFCGGGGFERLAGRG
jgi:hypothetical protein